MYCFYKEKIVTRRCPTVALYVYYLSSFSFRFAFLLHCSLLRDLLDFCVLKNYILLESEYVLIGC